MVRVLRGLALAFPMAMSAWTATAAERSLEVHWVGQEGLRLFQFLSELASPETRFPFVTYGDTTGLGCSEYSECRLVIHEKEWIAVTTEGWTTWSFIKPFGASVLAGTINKVGPSLRLDLLTLNSNKRFSLINALPCRDTVEPGAYDNFNWKGDCTVGIGPRTWPLERQESVLVVGNSNKLTFFNEGPAAKKLFQLARPDQVKAVDDEITKASLDEKLYCWKIAREGEELQYHCQGELDSKPNNLEFTHPLPAQRITLKMRAKVSLGMLDRYEFILRNELGIETIMDFCGPLPIRSGAQCRYWYDSSIDVSDFPQSETSPSGIAVGWGVVPQEVEEE